MKKLNWKTGGLAALMASAAVAGALSLGQGVNAQTTNPPTTTPSAPTVQQPAPLRTERGGHKGGRGANLAVVATAIGIDEATLRTELQSGKTIADVAKAKGVDVSKVSAALLDAEKTHLAQEVTEGDLTQAQADEKLKTAETRIATLMTSTMPQGGLKGELGGRGGHKGGRSANLAVVATAIGIDEATLRTELQSGKTIADVAKAKGVDVSKVSAALLDAEKTRLAQAVTDGTLTQAQADAKLKTAETRIAELIAGTMPQKTPKTQPSITTAPDGA